MKSINVPGVCDKRVPIVKYYHTNVPGRMGHVWVQSPVQNIVNAPLFISAWVKMQVSVERLGLLETEILSFHPSKLFPKVNTVSDPEPGYGGLET